MKMNKHNAVNTGRPGETDRLDLWLEAHMEQMIKDLAGLVEIDSVAQEPADQAERDQIRAPFGAKCREVLDKMLSYGKRDGIAAFDHEGYCGSLSAGEGAVEIGIWNHLDVVPAGEGWLYEPFELNVKDGCLIGRGVQDNKGPAIAVYYALRYCREQGMLKNIRVRHIFGCQEESGMGDVEYYLSHNPAPAYSFVADSSFPVCCGEKGICHITLKTREKIEGLCSIHGGTVCNSVPNLAEAELMNGGGKVKVCAEGIGGHAASPDNTVNAIGILAEKLKEYPLSGPLESAVTFLQKAGSNGYGEKIGIGCRDEISGRLTCNAGVLFMEENRIGLVLDIRYPVSLTTEDFLPKLTEEAEKAGFEVTEYSDSKPYYMEKDHPFIGLLMDAWREETGLTGEPFVMGGGTYARHIPKAVAFGTGMARDLTALSLPAGHGSCHGADEAEVLDNLKKAIHIYVKALGKIDDYVKNHDGKISS